MLVNVQIVFDYIVVSTTADVEGKEYGWSSEFPNEEDWEKNVEQIGLSNLNNELDIELKWENCQFEIEEA
jgi:hypothetical protein